MPKNDRDNKTDERDHGSPDVVWQLSGDGMRPSPAPWGFVGRNPLGRTVPPGMTMRIDLGVSANVPMMVFPTRARQSSVKVLAREGVVVVPPGEPLYVVVSNASQSYPDTLEDGESLVCMHPLTWSGSTEVG